jgi:hypothetical protein
MCGVSGDIGGVGMLIKLRRLVLESIDPRAKRSIAPVDGFRLMVTECFCRVWDPTFSDFVPLIIRGLDESARAAAEGRRVGEPGRDSTLATTMIGDTISAGSTTVCRMWAHILCTGLS